MTEHDRWSDSLGAWLLGALPEDEAEGFRRHLDQCAVCQEDAATLQVAVDALPASVEPRTPPPALKDRIMAVVEAEAPRPAPEPERRPKRSWLGSFAWRPALAVGLAALALGFVGAQALQSGGTETITAQVQGGGSATLEVEDDHGTLVATDLPAPPSGRVYQVWLDKGGPAPEPTDALFSTRNGNASVDVPGSLEGVRRVMVTDEPPGGSDAPSGKLLLTAST